jgi:SPP1 family predicted phage head-tail adaptor
MRAGSLPHRLVIESKTEAPDDLNEPVETWSTLTTVWGRVNPMKAAEGYEAAQNVARVTHEITIRYLSTVTENMRIVHDSRNFYIQGIRNREERNVMLTLECNERV